MVKNAASKRAMKGRSLLEALDSYVVVDIETTGLSPSGDRIIEVAAVRVENGAAVQTFQSLINPQFEINGFISELTGITNEMLSNAPLAEEILPAFAGFVGNGVVVAHNANFDVNFIYDNCIRVLGSFFVNDFVDTMRVSRRMFRQHARHTLSDLTKRFGVRGGVEHRALSDAMMTRECYEYMKNYAAENAIDFKSLYPK